MTPPNPTQLRLGAKGILETREYEIIGRVVMSVRDEGEIYYWNEFQLRAESGAPRILVYEETADGGVWRLFDRFDPPNPMSISDAGAALMGQTVHLDGRNLKITFLGRSRVAEIEGWAPPGEFLGKEEEYFNAEAGRQMVVVSYTPEVIEFYRGETIPGRIVEEAFHIPHPPCSAYALSRYSTTRAFRPWTLAFVLISIGVGCAIFLWPCRSLMNREPAVQVYPPPSSPAVLGQTISIQGETFEITGDDLMEVQEPGLRYSRHVYTLKDSAGANAHLVAGLHAGGKEWVLLRPVVPAPPLTPVEAGGVEAGRHIEAQGRSYKVSNLFLTRPPGLDLGTLYGFVAADGTTILLEQWDADGITCEAGSILSAKDRDAIGRQFKNRP